MSRYKELKNFSIFQDVSNETMDKIDKIPIHYKEYDSEETVWFFGEEIKYINFVLSGSLKTNEYAVNGKEIVSSYYNEYDAFPFYLIFSGMKNYPYNVISHKKSRVLHVPIKPLMDLIQSDSKFMWNVLIFVSEYCNYNKRVIRTTAYSRVIQRLAFWLLTSEEDGDVVMMPGTQEVFADILQTSRSTLNQELRYLGDIGAIRLKGQQITILDRELLGSVLEE